MTTSTSTRKEKVAQLQKAHEPKFAEMGVTDPLFDSKAQNKRPPGPIGEVGFFESQLSDGRDIYFELNDFYQGIIDNKRTLYKLRANVHFKSEPQKYRRVEDTPAGEQYYVNIKHFEKVSELKDPIAEAIEHITVQDINVDQLTGKDWACIHLKVPESNHPWLNDLIRKSRTMN